MISLSCIQVTGCDEENVLPLPLTHNLPNRSRIEIRQEKDLNVFECVCIKISSLGLNGAECVAASRCAVQGTAAPRRRSGGTLGHDVWSSF